MKRPISCCAILLLCCTILYGHDDVSGQIAALNREIRQNPDQADLYLKRGELYRHLRNWNAALGDYDRAARLDANMHAADLCRGLVFLASGQLQKAKEALDRFLLLEPENITGRLTRARTLSKLQEKTEALREYSFIIDREPQPEIYLERAQLIVDDCNEPCTNHIEEALRDLDDGIKKMGPLVTLELYAIDLELRLGRTDEALQRLDLIAVQAERKETWLSKKGDILEQAGRLVEAQQAYKQALAAFELLPASRRRSGSMIELESHLKAALQRLEEQAKKF